MQVPFESIVYISLPKAITRRKKLFAEFERINLKDKFGNDPVLFAAKNGNKPSHQIDNSIKRSKRLQPISISEIGCFDSHRQVWMEFLKSEAETILILEDDARFGRFYETVFTNWSKFPEWDYVNFGFITNEKSILNALSEVKIQEFPMLWSGSGMWLTHAYCLNRKAAQFFLENTETQTGGIDWQLTGLQSQIKSFGFKGNHVICQQPPTMCFPSFIKHTQ